MSITIIPSRRNEQVVTQIPTGKINDLDRRVSALESSGSTSAQNMVTYGRNSTGSTLYRGQIVYISGSTGNRPNFTLARADSELTSSTTFGAVVDDIADNADGYICQVGSLENLDTRTTATNPFTSDILSDGDVIYLSPTNAGYVTNIKPTAPNHLVYVGRVIRTHPTQGYIVYQIQNGYELDELHNVLVTAPSNNQALVYESSTSLWKNKPLAIQTGSVDPTTPEEGQLFINTTDNGYKVYYGGSWQTLHTLTTASPSYLLQEDGSSFVLQEDGVSKVVLQ